MILYINTTLNHKVEIAIKTKDKILAKRIFRAAYSQAEKLLPQIDKLLKAQKIKIGDFTKVEVENYGGSFTALRLGVVTANALAYALGVPVAGKIRTGRQSKFNVIQPVYDREPNITVNF